MKQIAKFLCLFVCMFAFTSFCLTGCDLNGYNANIDDGFDTDEYSVDYIFDISASKDKMTFKLENVGFEGEELTIVALQPYQYMSSEDVVGLAEEIYAQPVIIASADGEVSQEIVVDRYFMFYESDEEIGNVSPLTDGIYLKYYCLNQNDEILAGPKYVTQIEAEYDYIDPVPAKSIKGVYPGDEYRDEVQDLGASHIYLNFRFDQMIVPNEKVENGRIVKLEYQEGVDSAGYETITRNGKTERVEHVDYNGQRYYFRLESSNALYRITNYDELFKKYTDQGVRITLIMLLYPSWNSNMTAWDQEMQPYFLNYAALESDSSVTYAQPNTGNAYGAGYWGAFMEFIARRYSEVDENGNAPHGLVQSYIIGNEIDYSTSWNNIVPKGHAPLSMVDYLEEYERELRIANQAIKKYYPTNKVLVSLTHNWTNSGEEYSPKNIVDYLTRKALEQGNYDFGFAIHPYCSALTVGDFWSYDTRTTGPSAGMNGSLNTSKITFSNLELWQLYLEQSGKLCNGKIRSVYLTEGGVSGTMELAQQQTQATGIAYAYYKASQLSCVEAFIYYRLQDHPAETQDKLYAGLLSTSGTPKLSYELYKYIDTYASFDYSDEYLKNILWSLNGKTHGYGIDCNTWQDVMALFPSKFDWSTHWDLDLITKREP